MGLREKVKAGQPLFKLDTSEEEAAAETARRRIVETDAELALAKTQLAVADAQVQQAQSAYQQAADELATKAELRRRNASTVAEREVENFRLWSTVGKPGSRLPWPASRLLRHRFPPFCLHKKRVPRQRLPRLRSKLTEQLCGRA